MTNNHKKVSSINQAVMSKIQNGEVKIHPRIYYIVLSVLGGVAVIVLSVISTYFMSVVTLWLRIQAAQGPAYGARHNLGLLIGEFPWWALLLGLITVSVIISFIRKFGKLYKIRLVYTVLLVVIVSVLLGLSFSYSSLPNSFKKRNPACVVCYESNNRGGNMTNANK